MIETMTIAASGGLIAAIVGVVQVIKSVGLPSRFASLLSLLLGIVAVVAFEGFSAMAVFEGVVAGLSASGLYSGTKATFSTAERG